MEVEDGIGTSPTSPPSLVTQEEFSLEPSPSCCSRSSVLGGSRNDGCKAQPLPRLQAPAASEEVHGLAEDVVPSLTRYLLLRLLGCEVGMMAILSEEQFEWYAKRIDLDPILDGNERDARFLWPLHIYLMRHDVRIRWMGLGPEHGWFIREPDTKEATDERDPIDAILKAAHAHWEAR